MDTTSHWTAVRLYYAKNGIIQLVEPNHTVSSLSYASRGQKTAGELPRRIVSYRNAGLP